MSHNITIYAVRSIIIPFKDPTTGRQVNKADTQHKFFSCWQTPTKITEDILSEATVGKKVMAYRRWVESISEDQIEYTPGYEDEAGGIEYEEEVYNLGDEHMESLQEWLLTMSEGGYTVFVGSM